MAVVCSAITLIGWQHALQTHRNFSKKRKCICMDGQHTPYNVWSLKNFRQKYEKYFKFTEKQDTYVICVYKLVFVLDHKMLDSSTAGTHSRTCSTYIHLSFRRKWFLNWNFYSTSIIYRSFTINRLCQLAIYILAQIYTTITQIRDGI